MTCPLRSLLLVAVLAVGAAALAQENEPAEKESAASSQSSSPAVHEVKRGPLRIEVELEGALEAQEQTEVALRPQSWSEFIVIETVPQGKRVQKGDVLVRLDTEKIDEQINDLEAARELAQLALAQAEVQLAVFEKATPLELEQAERAKTIAQEDLQYFLDTGRPLRERSAEQSLRQAEQNLEYTQEELDQLEKMYSADDLTEETEEIVLKRARNSLETAKFYLERTQINTRQELEVELPREDVSLHNAARQQELTWEKAQDTLPATLQQKRLELEKMRYDQKKPQRQLEKLQADRAAMEVKAPVAGIVYYGAPQRGNWPSAAEMNQKLRRGGRLAPQEVFMTIVQPRPLQIRASVEEKQLYRLTRGLRGTATPTANPELKLAAELVELGSVPLPNGNFDALIEIDLDRAPLLMPGMHAIVKLMAYEKEDALTIPSKALQEEGDETFVYVQDGEEHEKRTVKLGKRTDDQVEIIEGLSVGDKILLEPPADQE